MRISTTGQRKIEFLRDWHAWKEGEVVEMDAGLADVFVMRRFAKDYVPPKPVKKAKPEPERAVEVPKETRAAPIKPAKETKEAADGVRHTDKDASDK